MPTALADTSCLIALTGLQRLDVLRELYDAVAVTGEVHAEFSRKHPVLLPKWITIESAKDRSGQIRLEKTLDPGEASLIQLARELPDSFLILDELKARNTAKREGLPVTGTIGVLIEAKERRLIEALFPIFEELRKTDFRFSESLERAALIHCKELPGF